MPQIGVPLGVLIGLVTGCVFLLLIRTAVKLTENPIQNLFALLGEILAIPTFWFPLFWRF